MIVKIAFQKQIHLYRGQMQLGRLKKHCENVFKTIPKNFQFYCIDNDGDQISLNSQQDLDIIFQTQQQASFKKIFIQQIDNQFQILHQTVNPEQISYNKIYKLPFHTEIKTVNIIKQRIQQQQMINQEANKFIFAIEDKIVKKIMEDEEKMIKQETSNFLYEIQNKLVKKIIEEEDKIVKQQVQRYMDHMINDCSIHMAQKLIHDEEQQINNSKNKENQKLIDKLVNEKINKMLPMLIKQISQTVQSRLLSEGCLKCHKKNAELEFEKIISLSLLRKNQKKYNDI